MFKPLIKVLGIIILIAGLGYFALCGIASYKTCSGPEEAPNLPNAKYSLTVQYTRLTIFTNQYEVMGSGDNEVYMIHGYWECVKDKFIYKDIVLQLNEADFGPVIVRER